MGILASSHQPLEPIHLGRRDRASLNSGDYEEWWCVWKNHHTSHALTCVDYAERHQCHEYKRLHLLEMIEDKLFILFINPICTQDEYRMNAGLIM